VPYVVTRPAGTDRTTAYTSSAKLVTGVS